MIYHSNMKERNEAIHRTLEPYKTFRTDLIALIGASSFYRFMLGKSLYKDKLTIVENYIKTNKL